MSVSPLLPPHPPSPQPRRTLTLLEASPEGISAAPSTTIQDVAAVPDVLSVTLHPRTRTDFVHCDPRLDNLPTLHAAVTRAPVNAIERTHELAREPTE